LEHASGPLADPYRTGHRRPLGSPVSNSLETPCSAPPGATWRFPHSSLRKGDEGAYDKSRASPRSSSRSVHRLGGCSRKPGYGQTVDSANRPARELGTRPCTRATVRSHEGTTRPAKASRKALKSSEESNHSSEALGATPSGCARAHPPEKCNRERPVPLQKSATNSA
jgi:hypothetical protein